MSYLLMRVVKLFMPCPGGNPAMADVVREDTRKHSDPRGAGLSGALLIVAGDGRKEGTMRWQAGQKPRPTN